MKQVNIAKRKSTRHFLLLQGTKSAFFSQLAKQLELQNCKTTKINFNAGDRLFWAGEAIDYTYSLENWAGYISDICRIRGVTDVALYDDSTPIHSAAIAALATQELNIHVFAPSYFDKNHITLELQGTNANSPMSRDPMFYMRAPTIHSDSCPVELESHSVARTVNELAYNLITKSTLKTPSPFQFAQGLFNSNYVNLLKNKRYFVTHLLADESEKAEEIIASFAKNTHDCLLVVNSEKKIATAEERVLCLQNADLSKLVQNCEGLIVCGSTAGIIAIEQQKPLVVLKDTIYNFAGLTNQAKLSGFWHRRIAANPSLYSKFKNHVAAKTQINGGFYGAKPIRLAVQNSCIAMINCENLAVGNNVSENV